MISVLMLKVMQKKLFSPYIFPTKQFVMATGFRYIFIKVNGSRILPMPILLTAHPTIRYVIAGTEMM